MSFVNVMPHVTRLSVSI